MRLMAPWSWPVTSNDDTLEDGVTYTVSFNVKPTQAAFDEAVKNHKDDANASGDNNFYTNDNSSATVDYKTVVTSRRAATTTERSRRPPPTRRSRPSPFRSPRLR